MPFHVGDDNGIVREIEKLRLPSYLGGPFLNAELQPAGQLQGLLHPFLLSHVLDCTKTGEECPFLVELQFRHLRTHFDAAADDDAVRDVVMCPREPPLPSFL